MGNGVPHGPVPDLFFVRTPVLHTPGTRNDVGGGMTDGIWEQIARTLGEFGLTPKGRAWAYQKPYPYYFDTLSYPHRFRVLYFIRFTGDNVRTSYEHVEQFLAQINNTGITGVHKIRLFPLSLSGTAFNWFTSLAPNSIDNWSTLEQRFHEYFCNGEVEMRLSNLVTVRQKYNESAADYLKRFREMINRCYNLMIGEKDLVDLAFADLASYLKDKMEGQDFVDMNQVLQRVVSHENRARDGKSYGRFKEGTTQEREKQTLNLVKEETNEDDDAEVCVAEWVDTPRPVTCPFFKPNAVKREEVKYTFDVSKCDKLFDVLVQGGVIKLKDDHAVPPPELLAKKRYCK
jgi:hypothetical protein